MLTASRFQRQYRHVIFYACSILLHRACFGVAQGECAETGVRCCFDKYQGARNFYNEALGKCETPKRQEDCKPQERLEGNQCVDISSAMSSAIAKRTTTTATGSAVSNTLTSEPVDCGEHGTNDPTDPRTCTCDEGWISNELAGIYCGISSIVQSEKIESMELVEDKSGSGSLNPWDQMTKRGVPFMLISFALICIMSCAAFRFCRWYMRRRRKKQQLTIELPAPEHECQQGSQYQQDYSQLQRHSFLGNGGWPGGMLFDPGVGDAGGMNFQFAHPANHPPEVGTSNMQVPPGVHPYDQRFLEHALRTPSMQPPWLAQPFQSHPGVACSAFGAQMPVLGAQCQPSRLQQQEWALQRMGQAPVQTIQNQARQAEPNFHAPATSCPPAYRLPQLPANRQMLATQRAHADGGADRVKNAPGASKPVLLGKMQPRKVPGQMQPGKNTHPLAKNHQRKLVSARSS